MDIFDALASTTDSTDFATVTGFSMHEFASYGKYLSIEWIGTPFVFVMHNGIKVIGFIAFLVVISLIINIFFMSFGHSRPARR